MKKKKIIKTTTKNKNIEKREKGNISTEIGTKIDINELHDKIGASGRRSNKIDRKLHEIKNQR